MIAVKHKPLRIKGYTLIELLIGITLITIVFTIGYASFREFSRRQALTGVSKTIIADLRLSQQLTLTGQKPEGVTCDTLRGYIFASGTNTYTLSASCTNSGIIVNRLIKTVTLDSGVTISNSSILFKVLGQGTDLSSDAVIIITHSLTGNSNTITVGKGGEIK